MESFHESLHYSTVGVARLRGSSRLAKALVPFLPEEKPDLNQAERETQWAEEETSAGFPTLHAYAAVTLYALLESIVRELLASWLLENEAATEARIFSKIKVPVAEVLRLSAQERAEYLANIIEREVGAGLKKGIDRFESLLEPFGLSGPVNRGVRDRVYELGQLRNNVVHKAMIVDKQLVEACPRLALQAGARLNINGTLYSEYSQAVNYYLITLIVRVGEYYKLDMQESRNTLSAIEW